MTSPALSGFTNPPNEFRPWPLFVLNDEYLPGAGEARLTELLENLARVSLATPAGRMRASSAHG
jgi:hypothetical protein